MAIVDLEIFRVVEGKDRVSVVVVDELCGVVFQTFRDRVRQPPGRVHGAVQDVDDRVSALLPWKVGPEDRGHVRVLDPWLKDDGTDSVDDDDRVRVHFRDGADEVLSIAPEREVVPVPFVPVHSGGSLARV